VLSPPPALFCVILERFWITPLPPAEALSAAEGEESRIFFLAACPWPRPDREVSQTRGRRESSSVGCGSKFQDALLIPSPVRRERDRVRDICAARFSDAPHIARGSRFRIRTLYGSASYLCVIPTEAEGPPDHFLFLAPVRMLRSARLVPRLARLVAGEAALLARVRAKSVGRGHGEGHLRRDSLMRRPWRAYSRGHPLHLSNLQSARFTLALYRLMALCHQLVAVISEGHAAGTRQIVNSETEGTMNWKNHCYGVRSHTSARR
jgi:hypothetical protein